MGTLKIRKTLPKMKRVYQQNYYISAANTLKTLKMVPIDCSDKVLLPFNLLKSYRQPKFSRRNCVQYALARKNYVIAITS